MKKAWLVIRLLVETTFGLVYMTGLLLLPSIWRGYFPMGLIVGFLGMPRRYNGAPLGPEDWQHFNAMAATAGLLLVIFLFLNSLLWFKDVFEIARKLKARRINL